MAAQGVEPRQSVEVAANPESAIAGERSVAIVDRQSRQFDRQPAAAIGRPVQGDAAEGVAGGDRRGDAAVGIELERRGDLAPRPPEPGGGARADQAGEFIAAEREAAVGIHVPQEAQRMVSLGSRRRVEP